MSKENFNTKNKGGDKTMKGRKPKPTALKVLEGNPGKRPLNKNEPKPRPEKPTCPKWISKEAKREWKRVAPELHRIGLLTYIDRAALAAYCEAWAEYRKAREMVHKMGEIYPIKDDEGNVKYLQQNPYVSIANKALNQIKTFCTEFGMTPSSRGRMQLPGQNEEDEFDRLLDNIR